MAMTFEAVIDDTAYNLNNGNPFKLLSVRGAGPSPVARFSQRSPRQHGVSDLGYRLNPGQVDLQLVFSASSASQLDTYRQSLASIFSPSRETAVTLRVTRDDAEIRTLQCHTTGQMVIDLMPEERAATMHRASIRLRASSGAWDGTAQTTSLATTPWWLAGGSISSAEVRAVTEFPANGSAWSFLGGNLSGTGSWAIAFVTPEYSFGTSDLYVFYNGGFGDAELFYDTSESNYRFARTGTASWPNGSFQVLHNDPANGSVHWRYVDNSSGILTSHARRASVGSVNPTGTWRASIDGTPTYWPTSIQKAAIYRNVSTAQLQELSGYMLSYEVIDNGVVNGGDVPAYPFIQLYGPIRDPIIANETISGTINLTGLSVGEGNSINIDLTTGVKTVSAPANTLLGTPAQLARFWLAPNPVAPGGTNTITLQGYDTNANTRLVFSFTPQYMSF